MSFFLQVSLFEYFLISVAYWLSAWGSEYIGGHSYINRHFLWFQVCFSVRFFSPSVWLFPVWIWWKFKMPGAPNILVEMPIFLIFDSSSLNFLGGISFIPSGSLLYNIKPASKFICLLFCLLVWKVRPILLHSRWRVLNFSSLNNWGGDFVQTILCICKSVAFWHICIGKSTLISLHILRFDTLNHSFLYMFLLHLIIIAIS